ncbi:FHA domain-containing protein [Marinibactrum halimedae]|uniref:FHA domain-containing protein n=1 Tax=Marinibactrum halimedae TaxID=1444977 RepID=A0AA37T9J4_9GAMM|nr:FHA domain-containing protein [Marinibactrum halimedae]MCD9460134.1 FHA domain-containing protein [Marinibactrum halimedae]GLS26396.1 hypothetical protein GCM10007877_21110 [Marinibactrum halimedae]
MARVRHAGNQKEFVLRPTHVFGRNSEHAHMILQHARSSRVHATITWNGKVWYVRDLSTNGTYINGKRLPKNEDALLYAGDVIGFSGQDVEAIIILDVSAPKPMLVSHHHHSKVIELEELTCLPNEQNPIVTLRATANGDWLYESLDHTQMLTPGDILTLGGEHWVFVAAKTNTDMTATEASSRLNEQYQLQFTASQNEEHIRLSIQHNDQCIDLGERTHHYLLFLLAKQRINDADNFIQTSEQGWLDKDLLCKDLGVAEEHLNILIFRFRKQINAIKHAPSLLKDIVQRRRREIRLNCEDIKISGGTQTLIP